MTSNAVSSAVNRPPDSLAGTSGGAPPILEVELTRLRPNPHQPRKSFDEAALLELASSIEKSGLIQPIAVVTNGNGDYTIVAGERRYRAMQLLSRATIPAVVLTQGSTDELALIENIQRQDLHPLEEAEAMAALMERHGYTHEALATVLGKARPTVTNILRLNDLPDKIKEECSTSTIATKSLLLEIAQLPARRQLGFWNEVKAAKTTVRAARAKKAGRRPRPRTAAQLTLTAGRRFLKRLQELSEAEPPPIGKDQLKVLAELREEIRLAISAVEQRAQ